jgi:hypothetical protein
MPDPVSDLINIHKTETENMSKHQTLAFEEYHKAQLLSEEKFMAA